MGDDNKTKDDKTPAGLDKAMMDKLNASLASLGTLPAVLQNLTAGMAGMREQLNAMGKPVVDTKKKAPAKTVDEVEDMTNAQLMAHMLGSIKDELMGPLQERLDGLSQDIAGTGVKSEVEKAKAAHPDFMEWRREITAIAEDKPGLTVEEYYTLAKHSNPEKLKELDAKAKIVQEDANKIKEKDVPRFGGLMPTSGVKVENSETMDPKTAAETAWDDAMADVPAEAFAGNA